MVDARGAADNSFAEVILASALRWAARGYPVFPCRPGGKTPATPRGFHDATTDPERIAMLWAAAPAANIGVATEGLILIDYDGPAEGWPHDEGRSLDLDQLPSWWTPRGGPHFLCRQPAGRAFRCTTGLLAKQLDTRADGGYFVAPPSRRPEGNYSWRGSLPLPARHDLMLPPPWLVEQLEAIEQKRGRQLAPTRWAADFPSAEVETIGEGGRNRKLFEIACKWRSAGQTEDEITAALLQRNTQACRPPLPDREVQTIAKHAARYAPGAVPPPHTSRPFACNFAAASRWMRAQGGHR